MKIAIGSDHAGFDLKEFVVNYLKEIGHEPIDFGSFNDESTDYPVYAKKVSTEVADGTYELGILVCGTGVGISIVANKVKGIRAVVCSEPLTAKLSREHNNSNILAFGARIIGTEMAKMIIDEWLNAKFDGERHAQRVDMICSIEKE